MKVGYIILAAVLVLVVAALPIVLVIVSPEVSANGSTSWLLNVKDMSIIYSTMFLCVGALLFIVMTALLAFIAFQIREHIVPAIQKVDDTAKTVKGTATFVSESVVSPIIKVAGAAAGARAMVQTLVRRDVDRTPKNNGKPKDKSV
jgi:hypothetical protein